MHTRPDTKVQPLRHVALGGFMGVGKSTVGRAVAARVGWPFVDLDATIEARHGPIPDLFEALGEAGFREIEASALRDVLAGPPAVIATGGGAWVDPGNRAALRASAFTAVLHAPLDVLAGRVAGSGRPLWDEAVAARYAARQPAYADADLQIDTGSLDVDGAAHAIVSAWARRRARGIVQVELGERSYDVVLADDLLGLGDAVRGCAPRARRALLVTDDQVGPLWAPAVRGSLEGVGLEVSTVSVPTGEAHKDLATWARIVDAALRSGLDRRSPIVALGGGVVGDMAGFAAACVQRGVPWVQVPTTSLAMADASVGGKTGFNHELGKNLVGAFHQPALVWAAMCTLDTLPPRDRRAGLAEVVKHALLDGPEALAGLERDAARLVGDGALDGEAWGRWIEHAVAVKARIVSADERETGLREVLNLGHTVAHGLETAALRRGWDVRHGEAVMVGLIAEARWADARGEVGGVPVGVPGLADRLTRLAEALGLPRSAPEGLDEDARAAMGHDKKREGASVHVPLLAAVGDARVLRVPIGGPQGLSGMWDAGRGGEGAAWRPTI
jgi:shikimate kinase/3-dehydroquinate synthase